MFHYLPINYALNTPIGEIPESVVGKVGLGLGLNPSVDGFEVTTVLTVSWVHPSARLLSPLLEMLAPPVTTNVRRFTHCRPTHRHAHQSAQLAWLQRGHGTGTVCHQRLGPAPHFWNSEGRPSLIFFVSHTADLVLPTLTVSRRLCWAVRRW